MTKSSEKGRWSWLDPSVLAGVASRGMDSGQASLTEAQIRARELYRFADHLDGGTPRAWAFHHPCDPPGTPWEPDVSQRTLMQAADAAREEARRILGEENR